jgi:hypothetical protein
MSRLNRLVGTVALPLLALAWGCESIALVPRPDIDRETDRAGIEQPRDSRDRDLARDEVVGTVQRVDETRNEIHLRTTEGQMTVIKYDLNTVVYSRDRKLRVDSLRYGDLVLVQMDRNSRGERYADIIRMNERDQGATRRY